MKNEQAQLALEESSTTQKAEEILTDDVDNDLKLIVYNKAKKGFPCFCGGSFG